jgi:hypothetical protein
MATATKIVPLLDYIASECGHDVRVWSKERADGWELHVQAGCADCERTVLQVVEKQFPSVRRRVV